MSGYERVASSDDASMVPSPLDEGRYAVDARWGKIQPIEAAPGVRTIGELELIEHLEAGRPAIDTRKEKYRRQAWIAGTVWIDHEEIVERRDEIDADVETVLFCNGPQCTATPDAIRRLLDAGHPAARILYYRGGMHDWMTLGLPVEGRSGIG